MTIEDKAKEAWVDYCYRDGGPLYSTVFEDAYVQGATEALASQWKDPKVELPEDGETVLIREHYRSAKSGRFVVHFFEFTYFSEYGFALEERRRRTLGWRVTHWMRIPPIKNV